MSTYWLHTDDFINQNVCLILEVVFYKLLVVSSSKNGKAWTSQHDRGINY